jgi:hypothetical protein
VLRPDRLSTYKNDKEGKLRHQVHLSDLTAVAFLKDPKQKRQNVFGLFSPSRNFHFEAPTAKDAAEWVELIRKEARIEEEEDEMFLASPVGQRQKPGGLNIAPSSSAALALSDREGVLSSSPEPLGAPSTSFAPSNGRRKSSYMEYSGFSGNELASHSDLSDNDNAGAKRLPGASIESLGLHQTMSETQSTSQPQPGAMARSFSQMSIQNNSAELDPERVIWQGWLLHLRTKGGVRQWKKLWGVLRPRNLILYKDGSEYTAQRIIQLSAIVNVVEIDPLSRSKVNCFQIITEEKRFRFCAQDEESLVRCLGAFKSLLAKRRELETRAAAAAAATKPLPAGVAAAEN